ncbi:hypothetical protein MRB53_032921 [Persea americana]|uniref:Uncharacterized protein n=1 Tax=Persea americana TaxID=3435 RepID=A0ACC2KTB3_PERAE|nr:hypothetical protein MRB53_032921 [Persea americana]
MGFPCSSKFDSWVAHLCPGFTTSDVVAALRSQSDPDLALDLFRWISQQRGYCPDPLAYLAIIDIIASDKRFSVAESLRASLATLLIKLSERLDVGIQIKALSWHLIKFQVPFMDKDADLSVKIKEGFGPSGLGIISVSDGITIYEYVVAMRAMSEAPAGSIDDDNQNVIYSPSGSATTGFSGGSSLGLQYKGAWCTPPRVFVDHQRGYCLDPIAYLAIIDIIASGKRFSAAESLKASLATLLIKLSERLDVGIQIKALSWHLIKFQVPFMDKDADLSVKIKEGFGPSGLGIISVSDVICSAISLLACGITIYEYVVAMRAMSEAPAGSIDDDNQNVIYSPSGSATTGFSGGSSLGLQYKGAWCTPPRVFVDHQLRTL